VHVYYRSILIRASITDLMLEYILSVDRNRSSRSCFIIM